MLKEIVEHDVVSFLLYKEGESENNGGVTGIGIVLHRNPKHLAATQKGVCVGLERVRQYDPLMKEISKLGHDYYTQFSRITNSRE